jgi:DNA-binding transcriptional MerR regulator
MSSDLEKIEAELAAIRRAMAQLLEARALATMAVNKKEAARLLGVSPRHISRMQARGLLFARDVGGALRFPVSEIQRLLDGPRMESSGATPERARFDGAKAMAELKRLRAKKR